MKIKALIVSALLSSTLVAQVPEEETRLSFPELNSESDVYAYAGFGLGPLILPIPNCRVGLRQQSGQRGVDGGVNIATTGLTGYITGYFHGLYFPNPDKESQFYMGAGFSGGAWLKETTIFTGALSTLLGNEYYTKSGERRFVQLDASLPFFTSKQRKYYFPLLTFTYGVGF